MASRSIVLNLTDYYGIAYLYPVYIGSNSIKENVIFDTGSGWLTIPLANCTDCVNKNYSYEDSTSATVQDYDPDDNVLIYGSASLWGIPVTDRCCLDANTCVQNFEFFTFYRQFGLDGQVGDGVLGIAPINEDNGPSFT